ncbi:MAG: hypothetical protein PF637_07485 [Spirochaetes bacterium]|jgi:hypothetical protein|nr:hypothetical protein [Spirochaetota bacterium]
MNREESLDFLRMYFNDPPSLHPDFDIIQKGIECFKHIPSEIEDHLYINLLKTLIEKHGIFPGLRSFRNEHFTFLLQVFYRVACSCNESDASTTKKEIPLYENRFTVVPDIMELSFLFNYDLRKKPETIVRTGESSINEFRSALDALLTEKRYVSVRSFNMVTINRFTADETVLKRAYKITECFIRKVPITATKLFIFLLTIILLDLSEKSEEHIRLIEKRCTNNTILQALAQLKQRCAPTKKID